MEVIADIRGFRKTFYVSDEVLEYGVLKISVLPPLDKICRSTSVPPATKIPTVDVRLYYTGTKEKGIPVFSL